MCLLIMEVDLYQALGLVEAPRSYSASCIKKAYRALARQLHPDKNGGVHSPRFLLVQAAYEILGDPVYKRLYDFGRSRSARQKNKKQHGDDEPESESPKTSDEWFQSRVDVENNKGDFLRQREYWKSQRIESAAAADKSHQAFITWKESLWKDLGNIQESLHSMNADGDKVSLLKKFIGRIESMRISASERGPSSSHCTSLTVNKYEHLPSGKEGSKGGALVAEGAHALTDTGPRQSKPGADFLAWLEEKRRRRK